MTNARTPDPDRSTDGLKRPGSRERLIEATVDLLRLKGPVASGTKEILARAEAPRGSFYFHFPDGKDQLVAEAVARAAAITAESMAAALQDRTVGLPERIEGFLVAVAADLSANGYGPGCAVAATTLDAAATTPLLRKAVNSAFASWTLILAKELAVEGISPARTAALADGVVAGLEGATLLARARHDTAPLLNVGAILRAAVASALNEPDEPAAIE